MQIYAGVGKVQSGHMTFMKYHHTKFVCGAGGGFDKKKFNKTTCHFSFFCNIF